MYQVMLVEDEAVVRQGIVQKIDWQAHGFNLIGVFENGKQALSAFKVQPAHVVITDINMPIMDGLTLAGELKNLSPGTLVILLTGYDEFAYAQKAIEYRVHSYILKPITASQLKKLLDNLYKELSDRDEKTDERSNLLEVQIDFSTAELRRAILRDVRMLKTQDALLNVDRFIYTLETSGLSDDGCIRHLQKLILLLREESEITEPMDNSSRDILEEFEALNSLTLNHVALRTYVSELIQMGIRQKNSGPRQVAEAVEYLKKNYSDASVSLQTITSHLSVSTSYFSGLFKSATGETFVEYLTRLRMEKAQEYLLATDYKNYEIAERVGYDDPGYFSSTFKKFTGIKPSEYRKKHRGET